MRSPPEPEDLSLEDIATPITNINTIRKTSLTRLLIFRYAVLEEVGLTLHANHAHPVERIGSIVKLG
jgi:hypothetical protein